MGGRRDDAFIEIALHISDNSGNTLLRQKVIR